jgi:hypothetical protein
LQCYLLLAQFLLVPQKWLTMLRDLALAARSIPTLLMRNRVKTRED